MADVVYPIFCDGPLTGQHIQVEVSRLHHGYEAVIYPEDLPAYFANREPGSVLFNNIVHYTFYQWGFRPFLFWVGSIHFPVGTLPPASLRSIAEQMISDRGKEAGRFM